MQKFKNTITTKHLQHYGLPIAILLVALSVYWAQQELSSSGTKSNSELQSLQCNFVNSQCRFLLDDNQAIASFSAKPEAEEAITLSLSLPQGETIESAWVEGVNMYMGKIPVQIEPDGDGNWQGWFMLGSCSKPVMQWQITLTLTGRNEPAFLYFATTQG